MSRNIREELSCPDCLKLLAACDCYDDMDDRVRCRARVLVDEAYETEDGQAMCIDPATWRDLRDTLDLYERAAAEPSPSCYCDAPEVQTSCPVHGKAAEPEADSDTLDAKDAARVLALMKKPGPASEALRRALRGAAAEPEAKAEPICDHGEPARRMVPSSRIKGTWVCEVCGAWKNDPKNPSDGGAQ